MFTFIYENDLDGSTTFEIPPLLFLKLISAISCCACVQFFNENISLMSIKDAINMYHRCISEQIPTAEVNFTHIVIIVWIKFNNRISFNGMKKDKPKYILSIITLYLFQQSTLLSGYDYEL